MAFAHEWRQRPDGQSSVVVARRAGRACACSVVRSYRTVLTGARNGFGKSTRLLKPAEFQHVFQGGRKRSAGNLAVYWRPNQLIHPRLGIAISRKCTRSAVIRNRIKRIVREAFRVRKAGLGCIDIVFLAHAGAAKQEAKELRAIVEGQLAELERCGSS